MTLEAWVNPSEVNVSWRDVIEKGNDNYYLEATSNPGGSPYGGAIIGGSYANSHGTANLTVGTWTHLALTYDGANVRFYVDGVLTGTTPATGTIASSATALTIGSDPFYGQYYAGLIDEIRIYNTALTQAQIQIDMATPITGGLSNDHTPPTVTISSPAGQCAGHATSSTSPRTRTTIRRRGRAVLRRQRRSRRRGHDGSLRVVLGHAHRRQRRAHVDGDRPRHGRERRGVRARRR